MSGSLWRSAIIVVMAKAMHFSDGTSNITNGGLMINDPWSVRNPA
jgi:hypothetical protein